MQTAGNLVGTFVELTTGVQYGHYNLQSALSLFLVHVHGDTATIVLHGYAIVFVNRYLDVCTISGQCLVDGVVHSLVNEVVQTLLADVADVHGGALAYSFQTLKNLDVGGAVIGIVCHCLFHCV